MNVGHFSESGDGRAMKIIRAFHYSWPCLSYPLPSVASLLKMCLYKILRKWSWNGNAQVSANSIKVKRKVSIARRNLSFLKLG